MDKTMMIAIISLSIAIFGMVVTVLFSWFKLHNNSALINTNLVDLTDKLKTFVDNTQHYIEANSVFNAEIKRDIESFKGDNIEQLRTCKMHGDKMITLSEEIKLQNNSQLFMQGMFEDMKRLNISTAGAINELSKAISKIEIVLNQALNK